MTQVWEKLSQIMLQMIQEYQMIQNLVILQNHLKLRKKALHIDTTSSTKIKYMSNTQYNLLVVYQHCQT